MNGIIRWEDPPAPPKKTRAQEVMEQLASKPGEWALIHEKKGQTLEFFPWYTPITNSDDVETKLVWTDRSTSILLRPYKVYARWTGPTPAAQKTIHAPLGAKADIS